MNLFNFINLLRSLSVDEYNRFIQFLNESRDYPYFSSLYDIDDFDNDLIWVKSLLKEVIK